MMAPPKTAKEPLFRKNKKMIDFLRKTQIKTAAENTEKKFKERSENTVIHVEEPGLVNVEITCPQERKVRQENAREVQTLIKTLSQKKPVS